MKKILIAAICIAAPFAIANAQKPEMSKPKKQMKGEHVNEHEHGDSMKHHAKTEKYEEGKHRDHRDSFNKHNKIKGGESKEKHIDTAYKKQKPYNGGKREEVKGKKPLKKSGDKTKSEMNLGRSRED